MLYMIIFMKMGTFSLFFSEIFFEDFIATQQVAPTIHGILIGASIKPFKWFSLEY